MKKSIYQTFILFFIIFIAFQHICFFLLNDLPVIDHEYYATGHMAVDSYYALKDGKLSSWATQMFSYTGERQPSMIGRIMGLACHLFGLNRFVMRQINLIFYILLVTGTYFIGKTLWDKKTGFWAAFLVSSMPLIISHSRRGDLHFFETALFTTCILMFVKSDRFKKLSFSILFGLFFGITLHTHETSLLYLAILSILLSIDIIAYGDRLQKKNFLMAFLIVSPFFLSFYPAAFLYPAKEMAMALYPWSPDLLPHLDLFSALRGFLVEFQQGIGIYNFYLTLLACLYLTNSHFRRRQPLQNSYYILIFTALIILPFLTIVVGSIFFKEVNTLQYLMPSYPLFGLIAAYTLGKIRFNLGFYVIFISNIWLWLFMLIFMAGTAYNINLPNKFPQPLTHNREDATGNSMFYPQNTSMYSAKKIRNYFKDVFESEKAIIYGFRVPAKRVVNRGYFDELLMHGIIKPSGPDSLCNPYYTDRNNKQDCQQNIFVILIYKDIRNSVFINIEGASIRVDAKDYALIKDIVNTYDCRIVKEFYHPISKNKIITVVKGALKI